MKTEQKFYQQPEILLVKIDCDISLTLVSDPWEDPISDNTLEITKNNELPYA
jgi:hypothetical protein